MFGKGHSGSTGAALVVRIATAVFCTWFGWTLSHIAQLSLVACALDLCRLSQVALCCCLYAWGPFAASQLPGVLHLLCALVFPCCMAFR